MNKNGNAGGSKKKKKLPPLHQTIPPPNQSLISNFFLLATNPNSQLNIEVELMAEVKLVADEDVIICQ